MKLYKTLVQNLLSKGCTFTDFENFEFAEKQVLLRHDIDFSLSDALAMAETESSLGVKSTYFVMLDSPFYSILHSDGREVLRKIKGLGHDIGIHFDPLHSDSVSHDLKSYIDLFAKILNIDVRIISFHRPGAFLAENITFDFVKHAYEPKYFDRDHYLSDSSGRIARVLGYDYNKLKTRGIQLLIHPIWWSVDDKDSFDIASIYRRFLDRESLYVIQQSRKNCEAFDELD